MGVELGDLLERKKTKIIDLSGKWVAIDAFNALYQFLGIIRQKDGMPLMDKSGRVTSHLSGILYRTVNLIEAGIKVVYVFDGIPPSFKAGTIQERKDAREKAAKLWEEAIERGDDGFKYAQAASRINNEMLEDARHLLNSMGIPIVPAPSEGEAQAAFMAARGDVDMAASQDFDSLLFGSPRVVRNLAVSGKRKLPGKNIYIEVEPEMIDLTESLSRLGITQKQLVEIGIMCGTDFNSGLEKVGPKTALKLIRENGDLESVMSRKGERIENYEEIRDFFLHPPVSEDYILKLTKPKIERIVDFLAVERDFDEDRVTKAAKRLEEVYKVGQSTFDRWL